MTFTIENEKLNRMPFPDVRIIRDDRKFTTSVYRESNFSGGSATFYIFLQAAYKFSTIYSLTNRCSFDISLPFVREPIEN